MTGNLKSFLDENGVLTAYPAKRKMKLYALVYLSGKLEAGMIYSEKEINELLNRWHSFNDPATLRRELFTHRFITRTPDGTKYSLEKIQPTIEELEKRYG